jgi:hypothetical protein
MEIMEWRKANRANGCSDGDTSRHIRIVEMYPCETVMRAETARRQAYDAFGCVNVGQRESNVATT